MTLLDLRLQIQMIKVGHVLTSSHIHMDYYYLSALNKVSRCSAPQNYMVMVFLYLIKPLRFLSEGALWKSALLAQEIKGNLCAWQTTQDVRKDEEGYYDR